MKKRSVQITVLLALLIMAIAMLAACDSDSGAADTPAPVADEVVANDTGAADTDAEAPPAELPDGVVTLTAFTNNTAFNTAVWGVDLVSSEIIARTGVNIEWEVNADDGDTRLNLIVASGDLPDIIDADRNSLAIRTLQQDGSLYSWCTLFERYVPGFLDAPFFQRNRTYLQFFEGSDAIYTVPGGFVDRQAIDSGQHIMQATGYYVNTAIMEALGNPRLETLDDLEHVLRLAVEYDPTLANPLFLWNPVDNGWDASGIQILHRSMGGRGDHYVAADGSVQHVVRCPHYRETLMFVNRLFNQGLISHNNFTDETLEQEAINTEGSWAVSLGHLWRAIVPNDALPSGVTAIPHPVQPGVDYFHPVTALNGWGGYFVTTAVSNPEAAARFLSFMVSDEGRTLVLFGIEDEHWEWGGPDNDWVMLIGEGQELMNEGWGAWTEALGTYRYHAVAYSSFDSAFVWGLASVDPFRLNLHTVQNVGVDASEFADINPDAETAEGANHVRINEILHPLVAQIAMAPSEAEAEALFEELVASVEASGVEGVEAVWTERVNANRVRLGR